jgi:hypothetical protein
MNTGNKIQILPDSQQESASRTELFDCSGDCTSLLRTLYCRWSGLATAAAEKV